MKLRNILLITLTIAFAACQDADVITSQKPNTAEPTYSYKRSMEEAIEIAINATEACDHARSRAIGRTASVENIKVITDLKSRDGATDSLLYVVNFDEEEGFVLVPIPRIEKEVLAIVDEGSYDPAIGSDNPGFNLYLEAAGDYIENQVGTGNLMTSDTPIVITPRLEYKSQVDTIAEYGNYHWLGELAWGQQIPYNKYTPNGYTGCAPTAMAMMIAALNSSKTRIEYTFPERDMNYEDVNWTSMQSHKRNNPYSLSYNHICYSDNQESTHNTIARFMRQIGVIANSEYHNDGSGTGTSSGKFESTLKYFLPDKFITGTINYKSDQVTRYLDWGYLLMWAKGKNGSAHAWLAEGYHFLKTRHRIWERTKGELIWNLTDDYIKTLSVTYFNWGWDGSYNGFYDGVVFVPTSGYTYYDPKCIAGTYIER